MSTPDQAGAGSNIDRITAASGLRTSKLKGGKSGVFSYAEIETVRETAQAIAASLNVDQVLTTVAERVVALVQASASIVYLIDHNSRALRLMTGHNIPDAYLGILLQPGEDVAGHTAVSSRPLVIDNYAAWDRRAGVFDTAAPGSILTGATSVAGIPLIYGHQLLGVLEVICTDQQLSDKDVALLQLVAPHAATAMAHAQLFNRNKQIMDLLETINDRAAAVSSVGQAVINAGHNLTKMSAEVLTRTVAALRLAAGMIFLSDPISHDLTATASDNLPLADNEAGLQRAAAHCMKVRQTILLQNMSSQAWAQDVARWLAGRGFGATVCVPLTAEEEVVGVLQAVAKIDKTFDTGELDTLHIIAGQLALGVANARLFTRVRAEQQQVAAILSSSSDVMIGLDATGRVQLANPAAERAFGFVAKEEMGRPLMEVTLNVALNSAVEAAIKSNQARPVGLEVPLPNDTILFCNLSPIVDPNGKLSGWVAVMQDITRFKETERLKSDMILTASHDLRNPVNLALGALDLLGKKSDNWTASQREAYDLSLLGVHRIEMLIDDLLDLERIERRVGLNLGKCDLADIARTVVTELRLQALQRNQRLTLTLPPSASLTQVRGDSQRLYQVISNLLSNAIKYTGTGGEVSMALWPQDEQVRMDVRDTGPGIPVEAQARLFERFYRAPNVSSEAHGTGLGLAIVKSIVEQHGGRVWVTSIVGQGSTFSVALPSWRGVTGELNAAHLGQPTPRDTQETERSTQ